MNSLSIGLFWFILILAHGKDKKEISPNRRTAVRANDDQQEKFPEERAISMWDGRIILSLSNKREKKKETSSKRLKACTTSAGLIGICIMPSQCKNFQLSSLHNNICFMDIFIPGFCCAETISRPEVFSLLPFFGHTTSPIGKHVTQENEAAVDISNDQIVNRRASACGIKTSASSRIINGQETSEGDWPWMAAIYTNSFFNRKFHCGGSLVSSRHILTGAHCVKDHRGITFSPNQLVVRLGDNDLTTLNDQTNTEKGRFYKVSSITPHPGFENINHYFKNDVAILKLYDKVIFSDFIFPICLPSLEAESEPLDKYAGEMSTIIGFGKNEYGVASGNLLEAKVPIWQNQKCDDSYFSPITNIFICAGYKDGGTDACQGDSGGPLQIELNNRWTQIGITSFGRGCGEKGSPGVYARIGKFVRWIKNNMLR